MISSRRRVSSPLTSNGCVAGWTSSAMRFGSASRRIWRAVSSASAWRSTGAIWKVDFAGVGAGEGQHLADEAAEAVGLADDVVDGGDVGADRGVTAALEELGVGADERERRAELVGGVGDEGALAVHGGLDRAQSASSEPEAGAEGEDEAAGAARGEHERQAAQGVSLGFGAAADLEDEAGLLPLAERHEVDAELFAFGGFRVDEGGAVGERLLDRRLVREAGGVGVRRAADDVAVGVRRRRRSSRRP